MLYCKEQPGRCVLTRMAGLVPPVYLAFITRLLKL